MQLRERQNIPLSFSKINISNFELETFISGCFDPWKVIKIEGNSNFIYVGISRNREKHMVHG